MNVTIKDLPDDMTEENVLKWVGVLVERHHNAKIASLPAVVTATNAAKTQIDTFKTSNKIVDSENNGRGPRG